jgi:hypothetical protein
MTGDEHWLPETLLFLSKSIRSSIAVYTEKWYFCCISILWITNPICNNYAVQQVFSFEWNCRLTLRYQDDSLLRYCATWSSKSASGSERSVWPVIPFCKRHSTRCQCLSSPKTLSTLSGTSLSSASRAFKKRQRRCTHYFLHPKLNI